MKHPKYPDQTAISHRNRDLYVVQVNRRFTTAPSSSVNSPFVVRPPPNRSLSPSSHVERYPYPLRHRIPQAWTDVWRPQRTALDSGICSHSMP
ncbi:hypothetical protein GWI33_009106 [Rhynchophorus ferrugineus]|uniref:Uncharacterized protein n=1 Tax=Rhynchophorus ferrugineus TaxID=354439 RepID=A0A834IF31_RHYFE|nr:hypothetical protein GWI33_009106 [Rhynchophorus ferrugineus]